MTIMIISCTFQAKLADSFLHISAEYAPPKRIPSEPSVKIELLLVSR